MSGQRQHPPRPSVTLEVGGCHKSWLIVASGAQDFCQWLVTPSLPLRTVWSEGLYCAFSQHSFELCRAHSGLKSS